VKKRYSDVDNGMDGDVRETWQNLEARGRGRIETGSGRRRREETQKKEYNARAREEPG